MEDRIAIEGKRPTNLFPLRLNTNMGVDAPMDSKDVIKSEVLEETKWLLDPLREAAGH